MMTTENVGPFIDEFSKEYGLPQEIAREAVLLIEFMNRINTAAREEKALGIFKNLIKASSISFIVPVDRIKDEAIHDFARHYLKSKFRKLLESTLSHGIQDENPGLVNSALSLMIATDFFLEIEGYWDIILEHIKTTKNLDALRVIQESDVLRSIGKHASFELRESQRLFQLELEIMYAQEDPRKFGSFLENHQGDTKNFLEILSAFNILLRGMDTEVLVKEVSGYIGKDTDKSVRLVGILMVGALVNRYQESVVEEA